jgi:hypothetical protein
MYREVARKVINYSRFITRDMEPNSGHWEWLAGLL